MTLNERMARWHTLDVDQLLDENIDLLRIVASIKNDLDRLSAFAGSPARQMLESRRRSYGVAVQRLQTLIKRKRRERVKELRR